MFCKNCGEVLNDNQAICLKCGVKVGDGNAYCANCGKEIAPEATVCLNCGVAVATPTQQAAQDNKIGNYDKIVIILVCLFLGGLGIHNFMLGETKKGVFKIIMSVLCGIGAILALIDLIKLCMGNYVIDPEKLV